MKTQEDEAWEEMERRQGAGGFPAKRAMAADKLHWSDCAVHNGPAYPAGPCDCGVTQKTERDALKLALEALRKAMQGTLVFDEAMEAFTAINKALAQPAQEPVAWMDDYNACKCPDNEARCFSDKVFRMMQKYTTPPKRERVLFPTMLRKMWSGGEVQAWLDENVNKERNHG
jgi:hypothetical protein